MIDIVRLTMENTGLITDRFLERLASPDEVRKPSIAHLQKALEDERNVLFVALEHAEIIAYALAYRVPSIYSPAQLAYLYDIEVLEEHRRKGIGRQLIEALKKELKMAGVTELWLGTATDNVSGQALFSATGAEKSGETFHDFTYAL